MPNTNPHLEGQADDWEASDQWIMGTLLNQGRNADPNHDHIANHFYDIPKIWLNAYSITEDEDKVGEWEAIPPETYTATNLTSGEEITYQGEWTSTFHPGWQPRCHVHFPAQQFGDLEDLYAKVDQIYLLGHKAERELASGERGIKAGLDALEWGMMAAKVARQWWMTESMAGLEGVKFFLDEGDRPEGIAVR